MPVSKELMMLLTLSPQFKVLSFSRMVPPPPRLLLNNSIVPSLALFLPPSNTSTVFSETLNVPSTVRLPKAFMNRAMYPEPCNSDIFTEFPEIVNEVDCEITVGVFLYAENNSMLQMSGFKIWTFFPDIAFSAMMS